MEGKVHQMKESGNVLFFIFGGFVSVIFWGFLGLIFCATVVGIPLGKKLFEVAKFALHPFNDDVEVESNFAKNFIANLIFIPFTLLIFCFYVLLGATLCITLVGAPLGKKYFELVKIIIAPFGVETEKKVPMIKEWEEWKNW